MKSGLWILGIVMIAAVLVGVYFNQRNRDARDWAEIELIDEPEAKAERLEAFVMDYPENEHRAEAFEGLADLLLKDLGDTARFLSLAEDMLEIEEDTASREAILSGLDRARKTRGRLVKIGEIEDHQERIDALTTFLSDYPESRNKNRAYYMIGTAMVRGLKDTAGLETFAERVLTEESDAESKAVMSYLLYRTHIEPNPERALAAARRLLEQPVDSDWIYGYIGYDLADREMELDLALSLCSKAIELSTTGKDSASSYDSRGWVRFQQGEYERAVQDFETAVALMDDPYEEFLEHLARAAIKAGDADRAFDAYRSILVIGEYGHARTSMDSLMDARAYSQQQKDEFERAIWETRSARAKPAEGFKLNTLAGTAHCYDPSGGKIALINFFSPT